MGYFENNGVMAGYPGAAPAAEAAPAPVAAEAVPAVPFPGQTETASFEQLCRKYKDNGHQGEMYIVTINISQDDDMDQTLEFLFKEPKAASYDRYVKTASVSSSKAMRTFVLDNICEEQKKKLEELLGEYPAMGISIGEKLLYMLGLSKTTTVRRL